jgi:hypothetical protein
MRPPSLRCVGAILFHPAFVVNRVQAGRCTSASYSRLGSQSVPRPSGVLTAVALGHRAQGCKSAVIRSPRRFTSTNRGDMRGGGQMPLAQGAAPGPRGRHLLAFLVAEHTRAIGHDEIAEELWDASPPRAWPLRSRRWNAEYVLHAAPPASRARDRSLDGRELDTRLLTVTARRIPAAPVSSSP